MNKNKLALLFGFTFLIYSLPVLATSPRFGYALRDGAAAIDPNMIYVICEETGTLVVHPEHMAETQEELGAESVSEDEWFVNGHIYRVQQAAYAIATAQNGADIASQSLAPIRESAVALAPAEPVCTTKVNKHVCDTFDCSGCSGGNKLVGGSMTYCRYTGATSNNCTLTGGSKTCKITSYSNQDCTGTILANSSVEYKSCQ